jgi:hypothetical protein
VSITKTRAEIDELCWKILEDKIPHPGPPPGYPASPRPSNFVELAAMIGNHESFEHFEHCWGSFLHNFFNFKSASFFALPPPATFKPEHRAWLAGCSEYLSRRFNLPVPAWTNDPEFFLSEEWDFASETFLFALMLIDMKPYRDERRAISHDAFLRRNVIFEPRALITL